MSPVNETARALGIRLDPWQEHVAGLIIAGERYLIINPKRARWVELRRVINAAAARNQEKP